MKLDSFDIKAVDSADSIVRIGKRGPGESGDRVQSLLHKSSYSRLLGMVTLRAPKSFASVGILFSVALELCSDRFSLCRGKGNPESTIPL